MMMVSSIFNFFYTSRCHVSEWGESKSNLQIWRVGGYILEALSKSANGWTSVHGITNDKVRQRRKGGSLLKLAKYL